MKNYDDNKIHALKEKRVASPFQECGEGFDFLESCQAANDAEWRVAA